MTTPLLRPHFSWPQGGRFNGVPLYVTAVFFSLGPVVASPPPSAVRPQRQPGKKIVTAAKCFLRTCFHPLNSHQVSNKDSTGTLLKRFMSLSSQCLPLDKCLGFCRFLGLPYPIRTWHGLNSICRARNRAIPSDNLFVWDMLT